MMETGGWWDLSPGLFWADITFKRYRPITLSPVKSPRAIRIFTILSISIVAISAIDLLKAFMHQSTPGIEHLSDTQMAWMVGIHFILILSGVLFAVMDKISENSHH